MYNTSRQKSCIHNLEVILLAQATRGNVVQFDHKAHCKPVFSVKQLELEQVLTVHLLVNTGRYL